MLVVLKGHLAQKKNNSIVGDNIDRRNTYRRPNGALFSFITTAFGLSQGTLQRQKESKWDGQQKGHESKIMEKRAVWRLTPFSATAVCGRGRTRISEYRQIDFLCCKYPKPTARTESETLEPSKNTPELWHRLISCSSHMLAQSHNVKHILCKIRNV